MCGIVTLKRNDSFSPVKPLLARYEEQKNRGQRGFGFVAVKDNKVIGYERATTFDEIEKSLANFSNASEIMFHHRLPTSTENLKDTAHPIYVSNKLLKSAYYFIHNGVIQNSKELKVNHNNLGFEYNTEIEIVKGYKVNQHKKGRKARKKFAHLAVTSVEFNDSESLAIEFALWNEGIVDVISTKGSVAFVCYEVEPDTGNIIAMHYGRNDGNPLKIFRAHGMMVLSSESTDQGNKEIETNKCFSINYGTNELSIRDMILPYVSYSSSSNYSGSARSNWSNGYEYPSKTSSTSLPGFNTQSSLVDDLPSKNTLVLEQKPQQKTCMHITSPGQECRTCQSILNVVPFERSGSAEKCNRTGVDKLFCVCPKCKRKREHSKESVSQKLYNTLVGKENKSPYFPTSNIVRLKEKGLLCTECFTTLDDYNCIWVKDKAGYAHEFCVILTENQKKENKYELARMHEESQTDFIQNINKHAAVMLEKIKKNDEEIFKLQERADFLESNECTYEEKDKTNRWLNVCAKIEKLHEENDGLERKLDMANEYINSIVF